MSWYRSTLKNNEHNYAEYIEEINFVDVAIESSSSERVFSATKKLLVDEYEEELSGGRRRKRIKQKAKHAANPRLQGPYNFIKKFKGRSGSERLVKEAIEKGYLRKIKLPVPWHPAIYEDEEKLTTFPHQHEAAVLYSGRYTYELWTKEYLRKINYHQKIDANLKSVNEIFNAESILKTGFLEPGGGKHGIKSKQEEKRDFVKRFAIYLTGTSYWNDGYILEIEAPTKLLGFHGSKKTAIWNIEDWFNYYKSPIESDILSKEAVEVIFAKKYGEEGAPYLPLKFVNGVHFSEFSSNSGQKHFFPLKQFAEKIYEKYPERIPEPSKWNLQRASEKALKRSFMRSPNGKGINLELIQKGKSKIDRYINGSEFIVNRAENIIRKTKKLKEIDENSSNKFMSINEEKETILNDIASSIKDFNSAVGFFGDFQSISLEELISENYLKKISEQAGKDHELFREAHEHLHESAEMNDPEKAERVMKKSEKIAESLSNDLFKIEIDENLVNLLLEIGNIENKDEKKRCVQIIREQFQE